MLTRLWLPGKWAANARAVRCDCDVGLHVLVNTFLIGSPGALAMWADVYSPGAA